MKQKIGYYRLMNQIQQEDESAYRLFIESLSSPASRIVYRNDLKLYAQYRNVETFNDLLKGDPRLLQSQIIDYIIYLKRQGLSGNSINTRINSIKKFYESNDIDLRWRKIKGYVGSKRRVKKDRPYTYEEIRKILDNTTTTNERERAVIYLLISSGMRIGALNTLKIKHLQNIEQYDLYKITVYENEEEEYTTFCTPECKRIIDSYLQYRELHGERLNEDSPLIREQFDIHDEIQAAHIPLIIYVRRETRS
jgi:site-specific recombinase XerD